MKNISLVITLVILISVIFVTPAFADGNNHYPLPGTTPIHQINNHGGCDSQYIAAGLYPNAIANGWSDGLCPTPPVRCGNAQVERRNPWFAFRHGCTDEMPNVIDPQSLNHGKSKH